MCPEERPSSPDRASLAMLPSVVLRLSTGTLDQHVTDLELLVCYTCVTPVLEWDSHITAWRTLRSRPSRSLQSQPVQAGCSGIPLQLVTVESQALLPMSAEACKGRPAVRFYQALCFSLQFKVPPASGDTEPSLLFHDSPMEIWSSSLQTSVLHCVSDSPLHLPSSLSATV